MIDFAESRPKKFDAKTVLLVDDDERFLRVLANELRDRSNNLCVLTAENGEKAFKILEFKRVDLVVTDLKMPVMNAFQLISHMKERYPSIPVIVMSSFLDSEVAIDLRAKGASQCIDKANISTLKEIILPRAPSPISR